METELAVGIVAAIAALTTGALTLLGRFLSRTNGSTQWARQNAEELRRFLEGVDRRHSETAIRIAGLEVAMREAIRSLDILVERSRRG